jgi:hypothetical protein
VINRLRALKPNPGEGRGVALGCLASVALHFLALIVVAILGGMFLGNEGSYLALLFLALIPVTQWIYLAPFAWLLGRRGSAAIAKGIWLSGSLVVLLVALCWGGMGLRGLMDRAQFERSQEFARQNPMELVKVRGIVTEINFTHIEVRQEDGTPVSMTRHASTEYIWLKADGGYEKRTDEIVKPGVRVICDTWKTPNNPLSASMVRVLEPGAERP